MKKLDERWLGFMIDASNNEQFPINGSICVMKYKITKAFIDT